MKIGAFTKSLTLEVEQQDLRKIDDTSITVNVSFPVVTTDAVTVGETELTMTQNHIANPQAVIAFENMLNYTQLSAVSHWQNEKTFLMSFDAFTVSESRLCGFELVTAAEKV